MIGYREPDSLYFPALPVFAADKLIGLFQIGDSHIFTIPEEFLSAVILCSALAVFPPEHETADRQIPHQYGFGHRAGIVEGGGEAPMFRAVEPCRSEEHTSELQSRGHLVCRLLPEKNK